MDTTNIEQMKSAFLKIESEQHAFAGRFYARLFELCPDIEQLFKRVGMAMQGKMVIQAVGIGINSYDHPDDFAEIFRSLGRRHALYGVESKYYPHVIEAWIDTCKRTLGSQFDASAESDWRQLLGSITQEMLQGAKSAASGPETEQKFKRRNENLDDPYLARFLQHRRPPDRPTPAPNTQVISKNVLLNYLGEKTVEVSPLRTVLEASHANGIPHICECGGLARCSTCRVMIIEGLENCLPRSTLERRLAKRKGFYPEIRLACQTRVVGDVTLKRLVRDENDIDMAISGTIGEAGEEIEGAVLFTDIWGFTTFSEKNLPYDVIHALNLLFRNLGQAVDDNDGYVDKYIGDNLMAIFGLGGERPGVSCRNAVNAASQMLASLPSINTYLRNYLGDEFRLGIGIAFGRMVTGEVGFALKRQFTAIGDTVNIAARLESETRRLQADLLVSDSVKANLMDDFYELKRSFEFDLKGKTEQVKAHEISVLK